MTSHTATPTPSHPVNLRIRADTRSLIDRAAKMQGKSRSDFMIEAARCAAEDALLEQTFVRVDEASYAHFLAVLDAPALGKGFKRLMQVKRPWEA